VTTNKKNQMNGGKLDNRGKNFMAMYVIPLIKDFSHQSYLVPINSATGFLLIL
jgi:hypothetical protein